MNAHHQTIAFRLSVLIILLAAAVSTGGLALQGLYHDNAFVRSTWLGNDLVTLCVAVPLLSGALLLARRGSPRARLVWLGMLDYMLYNYAFYLFAAAFNAFFMLYVALLVCSIFALVYALGGLDVPATAAAFRRRTPVRWIAGYMLFVSLGLTTVYLAQSLGFIFSGALPAIVTLSGHPTSIVFALDLTLLVPVMLLGGLWLWQRKAWGYTLAGISLVKGAAYTLVLSVNSLWASKDVLPGASAEAPLWVGLTLCGALAAWLLYANLAPEKNPPAF